METPNGPLTLRVYVGEGCKGTIYQDDGKSYDFKQGKYLRMDSTCSVDGKILHIQIGQHEGSYKAWWRDITIEVYGRAASDGQAKLAGKSVKAIWNKANRSWQMTVPDSGDGMELTLE
jgi:alpha-glucosidase